MKKNLRMVLTGRTKRISYFNVQMKIIEVGLINLGV